MSFSIRKVLIGAALIGYFGGFSAAGVARQPTSLGLSKRQDGEGSEIESTTKLRKCKEPRPVYEDQDEVKWWEVNFEKNVFEVKQTTKKGDNNIPAPKDAEQGTRYVVDHIFELQLITWAFDDTNRQLNDKAKAISDEAWKKANVAVNGGDNCAKVAEAATILDNLRGISERPNLGKEAVYNKVVKGDDTKLDSKWDKYLPALSDYIKTTTGGVDTTITKVGDALGEFTDSKVKDYFIDYARTKHQAGQDYIDKYKSTVEATPPPPPPAPAFEHGWCGFHLVQWEDQMFPGLATQIEVTIKDAKGNQIGRRDRADAPEAFSIFSKLPWALVVTPNVWEGSISFAYGADSWINTDTGRCSTGDFDNPGDDLNYRRMDCGFTC